MLIEVRERRIICIDSKYPKAYKLLDLNIFTGHSLELAKECEYGDFKIAFNNMRADWVDKLKFDMSHLTNDEFEEKAVLDWKIEDIISIDTEEIWVEIKRG